jgi:hypothetical protein
MKSISNQRKKRYNECVAVERTNSGLKDNYGTENVRSKKTVKSSAIWCLKLLQ